MLERPALRQLAQRIVARYHLGSLSKPEVAAYVRHRLEMSGTQRQLFPEALMGRLYRLSKGVPRIINVLCDRALLGAYTQGKERVDHATLAQAAREVFGQRTARRRTLLRSVAALLMIAMSGALALGAYRWVQRGSEILPPPATTKSKAPATDPTRAGAMAVKSAETLVWPENVPRTQSRELAYAALFRAWGANYEGGDACRQAERASLHCRVARGGLDELRETNRPAVLHMRDEQGQEFYATLTQLDGNTAILAVANETRQVALEVLALQWSGHYTVLWRLPPQAQEHIRFGERGAAVVWLNQQLPQEQGSAAQTSGEAVFDDALARRLKQFQLTQGLIPDGVIGPQTLLRLSALSDQSAPKLMREHAGK
jgi:general secretion pathway protein A